MKKKPKAKAPPRPPCVITSYETFRAKRAEKAKRAELAQRRRTAFVGSILEGEVQ
jgi:hypothetical protein